MGKTENEILSIVEAAADKATVNPDVAKNENPQKPEIKIETTAEAFVEAVLQMGTTLQQAKTAILKMSSLRDAENRKNTNNWRKMHGLPMRRNGVDSTQAMAGLKKALQNATSEGKSMDEALSDTIGSIKNAKTETEAMQIATELFGKKGAAEMTKAIRENRIDLTSLSSSMEEYGSTVEDTYNGIQTHTTCNCKGSSLM